MENIKEFLNHEDISFTPFDGALEVTNKADNKVIAYVKTTTQSELNNLIKRSKIAQKEWAKLTPLDRADALFRWYELVKQNREILAKIMTMEQGKPLSESIQEIEYGASFIRWFAEEARRIEGDILSNVKPNQKLFVLKQPIGVTAAITPWNFPVAMITRKASPALGAGCSMIVKPSRLTPLSAYAQNLLARKAGILKDVFMVVSGDSAMMLDTFTTNQTVTKISFTGSTEVGAKIYRQSAQHIKKLSLELGGNAPLIVFDDADISKAVDGIMASKFRNSGQTCVCANRIYVQSGIYDELSQKIYNKISALKLGNGLDNGVTQGPLIDEKAVLKALAQVEDSVKKGAKCLIGGKRSALGGTFFEPTLLVNASQEMLIASKESFAPLCALFKFDSEDEVISMANDTSFGLAGYIFTSNSARGWRVSEALECGMVGINTGSISNEVAPFGGIKQSGLGREGSRYGMDEYLEIKYLCMDLN